MSEEKTSVWRDFAESITNMIVSPARWSFGKAHAVSPTMFRVITYPLAAVVTVATWALVLALPLIILGLIALFTWISGGYSGKVMSDADREAAREEIRAAKAGRPRQKAERVRNRS